MQRNVIFLGLVASVGLLLTVFAFALKNPELFIDDVSGSHGNSSSLNSAESALVGATISGEVVGSQETQMRESAKIKDNELDALKNEQWLQQAGPATEAGYSFNDALDFAPERPAGAAKPLPGNNRFDANTEIDNDSISEESLPSTERVLQELNSMLFTDIGFQFGQLTLSSKALKKIDVVANILKAQSNINAKIKNYTDSYGDENFNLELSRQRANMVYEAFLDRGVSKRKLSFEGLGESNPVTSNATLAGRKQNRRTEIQFFEAN